ncbi:MAG: tetratricopeptide repeat protein [Pirellulaceae bacterium]|jgi:Flp pilus assembly protein TadD
MNASPMQRRIAATCLTVAFCTAGLSGCKNSSPSKNGAWGEGISMKNSIRNWFPEKHAEPQGEIRKIGPKEIAKSRSDIQYAMAESHEIKGNDSEALRVYQQILDDAPDATALHRSALLLYKRGDRQEAWEYMDQAVETAPDDAELLCDIGYLHYLEGRLEEAESALQRSIEQSPHHRRAHNNLGLVLAAKGSEKDALHAFRKAGLSNAQCESNLGHAMMLAKSLDEARPHLELAAKSRQPSQLAQKTLQTLDKIGEETTPQMHRSEVVQAAASDLRPMDEVDSTSKESRSGELEDLPSVDSDQ